MAKDFDSGFPGQAAWKGNAQVLDDGLEPGTPPVEVSVTPPERPVTPDTEPTFEPATDLPTLPPEQALYNALFNDLEDEEFPGDLPDFLDFF